MLAACQPDNPLHLVDGDTLRNPRETVRLQGMDAPEIMQQCVEGDRYVDCGVMAREHLRLLIDNEHVRCEGDKRDRWDRRVAMCYTVMVRDLGRRMVLDGWAVSYFDYHEEEKLARAGKRGMWRYQFERPVEWRRRND